MYRRVNLWVEEVILVKGVPWVGDGGVSGVSLSVVSSADDKNGEIAGNGGIWSDDGSSDGSDYESDAGGILSNHSVAFSLRERWKKRNLDVSLVAPSACMLSTILK
ncbi:hypothetical protein Tco_0926371 [Tanacetum coccineum]|uniref:Uncharacterized protein n=1 Tax=Tanacetum coccineum TaxID=301880 RepID=A0ABQ5DAF3_9ASTR